jgi:hypothetical protein
MHLVDTPTLQYAKRFRSDIVGWNPLLHTKNGQPLFNTTEFVLSSGKKMSVFSIKPIYYEAIGGFWRPLSEITEQHGNRNITLNQNWRMATPRFIDWLSKRQSLFGEQLLLPSPFGAYPSQYITRPMVHIGMTTTTVYPDPSSGSTTVDGFITSGYRATMQLAHDVTTGDGSNVTSPWPGSGYPIMQRALRNASGYYLGRCYFLFDTSAIDSGDTISSATLSLYGNSFSYSNASTSTYHIVASSPASNNTLATTDFDNISFTSFASIDYASMSQSSYNDFSLDSNGIANVTKAGISKFGSVNSLDLNVTSMTSGHDNIMSVAEADASGTSTDPKLVVIHTAGGATFTPRVSFIM